MERQRLVWAACMGLGWATVTGWVGLAGAPACEESIVWADWAGAGRQAGSGAH